MSAGQASRYRFVIMGLCFLIGLTNYMDRSIISFAIKPIKHDLGLNDTRFGLVISMFAAGTLAVNGISGWILDRTKLRVVWTIAIFVWSVVMVLLGFAHSLVYFLILRFSLGVAEGTNFPAMNRSMANWMPPEELSRMVSVGLLGVPLAMLIGGPFLSHLIDSIGWRWSFACLGFLGLGIGVVWILLYRNGPFATPRRRDALTGVPWHRLIRDRDLLLISWSFFAFGYVLFFGISWLPGYLEQTYGMKLTTIGWFSTLPWAIAIVLMPIAGWISDRLMVRTGSIRKSRIHIIWICQLVAAAFFIPLIFATSSTIAIACLSFAIGISMMPNSPYYSICTDLFREDAGAATGIMISFFSLSGIVSPLLTGWLTHKFGGFSAAFIALAALVISAVLGLALFAHPDRRAFDADRSHDSSG